MSVHEFCDGCPGCRPAIVDMQTMRPIPPGPTLDAINKMWDTETTYAQRKSFIEFTMRNSRAPDDVMRTAEVMEKIKAIMTAIPVRTKSPSLSKRPGRWRGE